MNTTTQSTWNLAWVALATILCCCGESDQPDSVPDAGPGAQADAASPDSSDDASSAASSSGGSTSSAGGKADAADPTGSSGGAGSAVGGSGTGSGPRGGSSPVGASTGGAAGGVGTSTGGATGGADASTGGADASTGGADASTGGVDASTGGGATGGVDPSSDPKGMTLYYVRHAQTVANAAQSEQPSYEDADTLTELGLRQIDALTTYLQGSGITPDAVLVSPTSRTQKTIEPYVVAAGLTGVIWPELTECGGQDPTGAALPTEPTYYEYFDITIEAQNMVLRDDASNLFWQNETYEQGLFMVMQARDAILSQYGQTGKTVLVSGHAVAGGILIGLLRGDDMLDGVDDTDRYGVYMMNTGIHKLVQDPATGAFTLEDSNINDPATE